MRMCENHWAKTRKVLQDKGLLLANMFLMEQLPRKVDPTKYGNDIYQLQAAIGGECPICFIGQEEWLDSILEEVKKAVEEQEREASKAESN